MADIHLHPLDEQLVEIVIDRPERRNAFDEPLIARWCERLAAVAALRPRAAILRAEGACFSAGYDLTAIDPDQDAGLPLPDVRFERVILALEALPCPVVGALNGDAYGGGLELALACDLRLAVPTALLTMTPSRVGLVYSPSGVARLVSRLGAPLTRRLLLTGLPLDARAAADRGLLDLVADDDALLPAARELARRVASLAPLALTGTRQTITALERALVATLAPATLAGIEEARLTALRSADVREGLAAFAEKRPPRFTGR